MAHLEKYTRVQLGHILKHDERARDKNGRYIQFGNQEIDTSRTHLNYNLVQRDDGLSDYEYIKQRAQQYLAKNVVKRENVNWAGSWVITLPEALKTASEADKRKFFTVAYDFLKSRYGAENIVSAYVHNDETTPHLHSKITPVIYDPQKGKYRFSAKDMFNRMDLKSFHQDLSRRMEREFGFDVGIYSDKRESEHVPNRSLKDLKAETKNANASLQQALERNDEILQRQVQKTEAQMKRVHELESKNKALTERNELIRSEMDNMSVKDLWKKKTAEDRADEILAKAKAIADQQTHDLAWRSTQAELEVKTWKDKHEEVRRANKALYQRNQALERENSYLNSVVKTLQHSIDLMKKAMQKLTTFFKGREKNAWSRVMDNMKVKRPDEYKAFVDIRTEERLYGNDYYRDYYQDNQSRERKQEIERDI